MMETVIDDLRMDGDGTIHFRKREGVWVTAEVDPEEPDAEPARYFQVASINRMSVVPLDDPDTFPDDVRDYALANWGEDAAATYQASIDAIAARFAVDPVVAVKAECRRRILLIMTEDQQRNTLAAGQAAVMTYGADPADWPPELQARQAAAMTAWAEIERLRSRSNEIETKEPVPADVGDDALWEPAAG